MKKKFTAIFTAVIISGMLKAQVLQPFHPKIQWGGRTNAITVHPQNPDEVIAASANGGLFKSTNGGATWRHISSLPVYGMMDVKYNPVFHDKVIATCTITTDTAMKIGIWLSDDRGRTWKQVGGLVPVPGSIARVRFNKRFSAYGISFDMNGVAYVGTDYGVAMGKAGHNIWTHHVHDYTMRIGAKRLQNAVYSVKAFGSGKLVIGAASGVYYCRDMYQSAPFIKSSSDVVFDAGVVNGIAQSPINEKDFIIAPNLNEIFVSLDTTKNFSEAFMPSFDRTSRAPVVAIVINPDDDTQLDIYVHKVKMWKKTVRRNNLIALPGRWTDINVEHDDISGYAIVDGKLKFITGDGGVFKKEGDRWVSTATGMNGYNALETYQAWGQRIVRRLTRVPVRTDYYAGLQDNGLWSTNDAGNSWPFKGGVEGGGFDGPRVVADLTARNVIYIDNSPGYNLFSKPNFTQGDKWSDPGKPAGNPKYAGNGLYIQFLTDTITGDRKIMETPDNGRSWRRVATFGSRTYWQGEKVSQDSSYVMYMPYSRTGPITNGHANIGLIRLQKKIINGTTIISVKDMDTVKTMGSLTLLATQFAWPAVYAFDPNNSYRLLAPDVEAKVMKWSYNGGDTWQPDYHLTNLITENGKYIFYESLGVSSVWTISFNPSNSLQIAIGTRHAGIVYSSDGGRKWCRVPGSKQIPLITSIWWDFDGTALVSSYGRGVWRFNPAEMTTGEGCTNSQYLIDYNLREMTMPVSDIPFFLENNNISNPAMEIDEAVSRRIIKSITNINEDKPLVSVISRKTYFGEMVPDEDGRFTLMGEGFSFLSPVQIEFEGRILYSNLKVEDNGKIKQTLLFKKSPGIYTLYVTQKIKGNKLSVPLIIKVPNPD
jgi:hypothetical protein